MIEWDFPNIKARGIPTSKEEVLKQVLSGLESANNALGTNYKLSQIYFFPFDNGKYSVYTFLTIKLIKYYHSGKKFREIVRRI